MTKRLWMYYLCGVCGRDIERVPARGRFRPLIPVQIDEETVAASVITGVCTRCLVSSARSTDATR